MAAKRVKSDANASNSMWSDQWKEQREANARLRAELEAERKLVRQLRRDKSYEVQDARETEQRRATVALNNLRTKLRKEKLLELNEQKEALTKRCGADLQRAVRQKDGRIKKLERDLQKTQQQVAVVTQPRGLSSVAREPFENERSKLLEEMMQLRSAKKSAEENSNRALEAEKKMTQNLQQLKERHKSEMNKVCKDADMEIKRMLEELRSKDRQLRRLDLEPVITKTPVRSLVHSSVQTEEPEITTTEDEAQLSPSLSGSTESLVDSTDGLTVKTGRKVNPALSGDGHRIQTPDKNTQVLDTNEKLATLNMELENTIYKLNERNDHMQKQHTLMQLECDELMEQLHSHQEEALVFQEAHEANERLRLEQELIAIDLSALQSACSEKDRRIELLVYKLKKKRPSSSKKKVVRFLLPSKPYTWPCEGEQSEEHVEQIHDDDDNEDDVDEDAVSSATLSPSSDMSLDDVSSIASDSLFGEQEPLEPRDTHLEQKYLQLTHEHLHLERSYALLQKQAHDWHCEKVELYGTIQQLKEQVAQHEMLTGDLLTQIQESHEQNETLEFQILELENKCEKIAENASRSLKTDKDITQQYATKEQENFGDELKGRRTDLAGCQEGDSEGCVLEQVRSAMDAADQTLRENLIIRSEMEKKIAALEEEKAASQRMEIETRDLVSKHGAVCLQLEQAKQVIEELKDNLACEKKKIAIQQYTQDMNNQTEARYKEQISKLERQVASWNEGRDAESELYKTMTSQLHKTSKKIVELEEENGWLRDQVATQREDVENLRWTISYLGEGASDTSNKTEHRPHEELQQRLRHYILLEQKYLPFDVTSLETYLEMVAKTTGKDFDDCTQEEADDDETSGIVTEASSALDMSQQDKTETERNILRKTSEVLESERFIRHEIECERRNLKDQLSSARSHLESTKSKLTTILESEDKLHAELKTCVAETEELRCEIDSHHIERESLLEQIGELKEAKHRLDKEIKEIRLKLDNTAEVSSDELQSLSREISQKNQVISSLTEKLNALNTHHQDVVERLSSCESARLEAADQHKQELEEREENWEEIVAQLEEKVDEWKRSSEESEQTWMTRVEALDLKLNDSQQRELRAKDQLALIEQEHYQRMRCLQKQLNKLENNEAVLRETIDDLRTIEGDLMVKLDQELTNKQQTDKIHKESEETIAQLKEALASKMTSLQEMEEISNVTRFEEEKSEMAAKVMTLEASEVKLKCDIKEAEVVYNQQKQRICTLEIEAESARAEIQELKSTDVPMKGSIDLQALETEVLQNQIKESEQRLKEVESQKQELLDRVDELEQYQSKTKTTLIDQIREVEELNDKLRDLEDQVMVCRCEKEVMKERLAVYEEDTEEEVVKLREKVDVLLDTEEALIDRVQQREEQNAHLSEQVIHLEGTVGRLQEDNDVLTDQVSLMRQVESANEALQRCVDVSKEQVRQSETDLDNLKKKVDDLERNEDLLKNTIRVHESSLRHKESIKEDLLKELQTLTQDQDGLRNKISSLEKREGLHLARVHDLEAQNQDLLNTMKSVQENCTRDLNNTAGYSDIDGHELVEESIVPVTISMRSISDLQSMSHEDLVTAVHQYHQLESFYRAKISDLQRNLTNLRREIEVVAAEGVELEVEESTLNSNMNDVMTEVKVHNLIQSETDLKLEVFRLQKQLIGLKSDLNEAQATNHEQASKSRDETEKLEKELEDLRETHRKLKNRLQYGLLSDDDSQPLTHTQGLEHAVFELETCKEKLERRVQELERVQISLRNQLVPGEFGEEARGVRGTGCEQQLRQQIQSLLVSETELKLKITQLEAEPVEDLYRRITLLERSERGLKHKLELIERHNQNSSAMMDTPEAVLKQRIWELETMERHMKQQVAELERDREELHEITRKDKNIIHEMNVRVRELQLAERNQREQNGRLEESEGELQNEVDRLTDRIDDLEDEVRRMKSSERSNKSKLIRYESTESDMSRQLENSYEEKTKIEGKLKKQLSELEFEKQQLAKKLDEVTDRLTEQEAGESALKQKLRSLETSECSLLERVSEMELLEATLKANISELEAANETQSQKLHRSEENNTRLAYEMSELETEKGEAIEEKTQLHQTNKVLKEELEKLQESKDHLLDRMDEAVSQTVELQSKLQESEKSEYELRQEMAAIREELSQAHGRDAEISELKLKLARHSSAVQAHEILRENYDGVKQDLEKLTAKIKSERVDVMSRGVEANLSESFTLRQISPGFRRGLQVLSSNHPAAYTQFVSYLKPDDPHLYRSRVHQASSGTCTVEETTIIAQQERPGGKQPTKKRVPTSDEKQAMIGRLSDLLAQSDHDYDLAEKNCWNFIEDPSHVASWNDIEPKFGANVDDVTLIFDLRSVTTDETSSEAGSFATRFVSEDESVTPSVPSVAPLNQNGRHTLDSYYPTSKYPHDDTVSADEADGIEDDDDSVLSPHNLRSASDRASSLDRDLHPSRSSQRRGNSTERNLDFNDVTMTSLNRRQRVTQSMDSIPDSGLESLREDEGMTLRKTITQLQDQLKESEKKTAKQENLRRAIDAKDKQIRQLHLELDTLNEQLKAKDHIITSSSSQLNQLQQSVSSLEEVNLQLQKKERELQAKCHENDSLREELYDCQSDAELTRTELIQQRTKLTLLEAEPTEEMEEEISRLELQLAKSENEYKELAAKQVQCQTMVEDKLALETIILKLRGQLRELEKNDVNNDDVSAKLAEMEEELRVKSRIEDDLSEKNRDMKETIERLTLELEHYETELMSQYTELQNRCEELEEEKDRVLSMIMPLRSKSVRFANMCKEKDEMIGCLAGTLCQYSPGEPGSEVEVLLTEADRMLTLGQTEEYRKSLSPLTVETSKEIIADPETSKDSPSRSHVKSKIPRYNLQHPSSGVSIDDSPDSAEVDITESPLEEFLHETTRDPHDDYKSQVAQSKGESARSMQPPSSIYPEGIIGAHHELLQAHVPQKGIRLSQEKVEDQIVGAPFTGPESADSTPRPLTKCKRGSGRRLPRLPVHMPLPLPATAVQSPPPTDHTSRVPPYTLEGQPDAPRDFHVTRVIGQHSILLEWTPPTLDLNSTNKGYPLTGYMVCINNKERMAVGSVHITKALIERLNLSKPQTFTIQTVSADGTLSVAQQVIHEASSPQSRDNTTSYPGGSELMTGDGDSVASSIQSEEGERRVFMAVYDYNPLEHSPSSDPSNELHLTAGEIVITHGSMQPDGFYQAKVNHKRGLVPAYFIEEVALLRSHSRQGSAASCVGPSSGVNSRVSSPRQRVHQVIHKLRHPHKPRPSKIPTAII